MSTFQPTLRIQCGFPTIYEIPLNRLSILQHAMLELEKRMLDLRVEANLMRLKPQRSGCFDYLHGMLNGIRFGFASLLIFGVGLDDYDIFRERTEAYENELSFLFGRYQERT